MGAYLGITDDTVIIAGYGKTPLTVSAAGNLVFCALGGDLPATVLAAQCQDLPELLDDSESEDKSDAECPPARSSARGRQSLQGQRPCPRSEPAGGSSSASPPSKDNKSSTGDREGSTGRPVEDDGRRPKVPLRTANTPNLLGVPRKLHVQYSHTSAHRLCALLR